MPKLRKVTIVILARSHNPSIVSPDWVRTALMIDEAPIEFIHTPPFSMFDSASFRLTVDFDRWELICKALDEEHMSCCSQTAKAYIRSFPHVKYNSFGMNYIWAYCPSDSGQHVPEVKLLIDGLDPRGIFDGRSIKYGGTVEVDFGDHILRLRIDYENDRAITLNYNFSYDMKGCTVEERTKTLDSFLSLRTDSERLTKSLLAMEQ